MDDIDDTSIASVKLRNGLILQIHESGEKDPIGVIIDLYKGEEYMDTTFTILYDDYKDED